MSRNPFAQPEALWQVEYRVPVSFVLPVEEALSDGALSVSSFECPEDDRWWTVQLLFPQEPDLGALAKQLQQPAKLCGVNVPEASVRKIEHKDWAGSLERDFPPLSIGRFFVHGAHAKGLKPPQAKPIQVEAGMAFGSGEHATTSGCLLAIDALAKKRVFNNVLDMGCGSGILAIGATRVWPKAKILAVDVDPVSVRITEENIRINRVGAQVRALSGNGYADARVRGPYDLILANILARPLVQFSYALNAHLAPGGIAVLSGLLSTQEAYVLAAHRRQGLRLVDKYTRAGWSALVLRK